MSKVDIGINLAIWSIISCVRQSDADFWEVFIDKGGCMVNILKLNESPAFPFLRRLVKYSQDIDSQDRNTFGMSYPDIDQGEVVRDAALDNALS